MTATATEAREYTTDELGRQLHALTARFMDRMFGLMRMTDVGYGQRSGVLAFFSECETFAGFAAALAEFITRNAADIYDCDGHLDGETYDDDPMCLECMWSRFAASARDAAAPDAATVLAEIKRLGKWEYAGINDGSSLFYGVYEHRLTGEQVCRLGAPAGYVDIPENDRTRCNGGAR